MAQTPLEGQQITIIADFLQGFISTANLRLRFRATVTAETTTPMVAPNAGHAPSLVVEFTGEDTAILIARNAEVLNALEHIAAKILRLEPEEHDRVAFDADNFKANRDRQLVASAVAAIASVRASGKPHAFPPMTSRERRMLHLVLQPFDLPTASSGEGPGRFVVLYPSGAAPNEAAPSRARIPDDAARIRHAFRPR